MVQIREILHILTDSSITLAYYSVPVTIYAYLGKKHFNSTLFFGCLSFVWNRLFAPSASIMDNN